MSDNPFDVLEQQQEAQAFTTEIKVPTRSGNTVFIVLAVVLAIMITCLAGCLLLTIFSNIPVFNR